MFSRYFLSFLSVLVFAAVISASAIHEPRFFDDDDNSDELVDSIGLPDVGSELEDLIDVLGGDRHRPPPPLIGKIIAAIKNALRWLRRHCIRDAVLECKQHVPHIKPWLKCVTMTIRAARVLNKSREALNGIHVHTDRFTHTRTYTHSILNERCNLEIVQRTDSHCLWSTRRRWATASLHRALLDLAVATLSSALLAAAADLVAPLSAPRPASRRKPWVTSQIRGLIRERDRVYRLFRRGGSSAAAYKELRSRVRNLLDTAKNRHLASRIAEAADMQSRWRALRSMGVSSPRLPSPLTSFSADELCSHYVAVGSRAPPLDISMATAAVPAERRTVFDFRHVVEDEVRLTMARCVAKGFGLDGISSTILRLSSPAIVRVMTRIVNASVDLSYFPVSWKTAAVIPLAKGSSVASPSDTRPISLLSELSKIVERIIHTQLSEYLSQSGLLDPGQHGFRPGHSTTTALLEITERARRAIDRREVSVLVSFDFSKAFDTIDHTILIRKLICSGCSDCVIEWFVSYLSGRSVCVRLEDGTHTEPRAVTSGVPQGSVLAPLLFSIFIADLPTCLLNSRHIIYADDTQIISHGLPANIGDLLRDVTRDANAVSASDRLAQREPESAEPFNGLVCRGSVELLQCCLARTLHCAKLEIVCSRESNSKRSDSRCIHTCSRESSYRYGADRLLATMIKSVQENRFLMRPRICVNSVADREIPWGKRGGGEFSRFVFSPGVVEPVPEVERVPLKKKTRAMSSASEAVKNPDHCTSWKR
ncbi:unnamed protein product [Trichogramma brassicae]|uniref:Reverse transcriptase domain-containing protein n=1 Tax=Trichogramma brassicae TaxID=86971 RepID=A0A6H5IHW5_9HYME|nr:unnamed protein product [Trichogramma brassicae]